MAYDRDTVRLRIVEALDAFIPASTTAIGRAAIIDEVTDEALFMLKFICGDSDKPIPRGLLSSPTVKHPLLLGLPIVEHPRCDDPQCPLCARAQAAVLGRVR